MKRDFGKVFISVIFGAVIICIMYSLVFFLLKNNTEPSIFKTYFFMLFIFFVASFVIYNNELVKKYCKKEKIDFKSQIKMFVYTYVIVSVLISFSYLVFILLNGGFENFYKVELYRYNLNVALLKEKTYFVTIFKFCAFLVFLGLQYFNAQHFFNIILKNVSKKLFKYKK